MPSMKQLKWIKALSIWICDRLESVWKWESRVCQTVRYQEMRTKRLKPLSECLYQSRGHTSPTWSHLSLDSWRQAWPSMTWLTDASSNLTTSSKTLTLDRLLPTQHLKNTCLSVSTKTKMFLSIAPGSCVKLSWNSISLSKGYRTSSKTLTSLRTTKSAWTNSANLQWPGMTRGKRLTRRSNYWMRVDLNFCSSTGKATCTTLQASSFTKYSCPKALSIRG